jgi:hypothetical protein
MKKLNLNRETVRCIKLKTGARTGLPTSLPKTIAGCNLSKVSTVD